MNRYCQTIQWSRCRCRTILCWRHYLKIRWQCRFQTIRY
jgi:hypothetical protein